jgi:hypothetical protein
MQDAIELSKLLETDGAFHMTGRPNMAALRSAKAKMMRRKQDFSPGNQSGYSRQRGASKIEGVAPCP